MISNRLLRLVEEESKAEETKEIAKAALKSYREKMEGLKTPPLSIISSDQARGIYNDARMPQERSEGEGERSIALGTPRGCEEAPHSEWTRAKINDIKLCSQTKIMSELTPRLVTDQALKEAHSSNSDFHRLLYGTPRRSLKERIRNFFSR
jgi:hypothetical protein